jgi:hypothetical protein
MQKNSRRPLFFFLISALGLLAIGFISGCSQRVPLTTPNSLTPSPTPSVPASPTSGITSQPELTVTPQVEPSPTPEPLQRPQYTLEADLDYPNQRLTVLESISLLNPAASPLTGISLVVPANNWAGVFSLQEVQSSSLPVESYQLSGVVLEITFGEPYWQPGETLGLQISFTLDLPQVNTQVGYGPSAFGYSAMQTNLVDWYVMVPPYQDGAGWLIHDPWIFGEYLVYPAADFNVSLQVDTPGLIVAASSVPLNQGDLFQYSLEEARNFVFSISPAYLVLEEDLNGIQVLGYIFPGYQVPGEAAFRATLEALDLYQRLYGPYQQSSLSMIQADFNHGVEYEGLYFLSRGFFDSYNGTEQNYLVAIAVHETAHQWWYGLVANDQALEPWLDEALCTFSELAYYEQMYPQAVDWWWAVRVDYYQPVGRLDRSIYGFKQYTDQYLEYRNATYLQGAKFLSQLKSTLGDEAFYSFLQAYTELYGNKIASGNDFFSLLGEYLDLRDQAWMEEYFPEIGQVEP